MQKVKKNKASALVVTMIILGIMIITGLSVSTISIKERKASIGETKSGQAFQNAQSGVELVMRDILGKGNKTVDQLDDCDFVTGKINSPNGYAVELFSDEDWTTPISCNSSGSVFDIAAIRSVGTVSNQQRVIMTQNTCFEADIDDEMVGHWGFDNDLDDEPTVTGLSENDAQACTPAIYNSAIHPILPADNVNSSPDYGSDGARTFISFNQAPNKNCAVIDNRSEYQLQSGTVSFWVRYRGDPFAVGSTNVAIISKDARNCNTLSDPVDVASAISPDLCNLFSPVFNDTNCDCGHLGFSLDNVIDNFRLRFQNDGNGHFYRMSNDLSKVSSGSWISTWHHVTLTFSSERYVLYIDGKKHAVFDSLNPEELAGYFDTDGIEALTGNDWKLWLGNHYPDYAFPRVPNWSSHSIDLDDLRIYRRVLTECEVMRLCAETG